VEVDVGVGGSGVVLVANMADRMCALCMYVGRVRSLNA
jgi:hypothetical protein